MPGHIQTNRKTCWQHRTLVEADGEAYEQEDLLGTMRGLLLGVPREVQEVKRMLNSGTQPKPGECFDFILYHQLRANDQMKATLRLVCRLADQLKHLDHKFAVPPGHLETDGDREAWESAVTERGNRIGELKRMTRDVTDYLDVVGDTLCQGFDVDSEVFESIEKHKAASASGVFEPWLPVSPSLTVTENASEYADMPSGQRCRAPRASPFSSDETPRTLPLTPTEPWANSATEGERFSSRKPKAASSTDSGEDEPRSEAKQRFDMFMWVFGPMASHERVCEVCHTRKPTEPWPFFWPYCRTCGDKPSYHHGRCCPKRRGANTTPAKSARRDERGREKAR